MHYEIQRVSKIKYNVVNKETGTIHSSWNRKKEGKVTKQDGTNPTQ